MAMAMANPEPLVPLAFPPSLPPFVSDQTCPHRPPRARAYQSMTKVERAVQLQVMLDELVVFNAADPGEPDESPTRGRKPDCRSDVVRRPMV